MKKNNLFQIGEVANLLGITRKTILDYENYGLIEPTYVDTASSYRYYDYQAISRLELILDLRNSDMSIKNIRGYLSKQLNIDEQIQELENKINQIKQVISLLNQRKLRENTMTEPIITTLVDQYCFCVDVTADDIENAVHIYAETFQHLLEKKIKMSKSINHFCLFPVDILSDDYYETQDISMKICFNVQKEQDIPTTFFKSTRALTLTYCGNYEFGLEAYSKLRQEIIKNNYQVVGYPREYYLEGSLNKSNTKSLVLVAIPIA